MRGAHQLSEPLDPPSPKIKDIDNTGARGCPGAPNTLHITLDLPSWDQSVSLCWLAVLEISVRCAAGDADIADKRLRFNHVAYVWCMWKRTKQALLCPYRCHKPLLCVQPSFDLGRFVPML
jgi:hypothetical protein